MFFSPFLTKSFRHLTKKKTPISFYKPLSNSPSLPVAVTKGKPSVLLARDSFGSVKIRGPSPTEVEYTCRTAPGAVESAVHASDLGSPATNADASVNKAGADTKGLHE